MVSFSLYPEDGRVRRAAEMLVTQGAAVDLICLDSGSAPKRETADRMNILRLPIKHRRGGKLSYFLNYASFIFISAIILAQRALRRPYDLVHIHNMPDVLVMSALVPKILGAKVILDLHDPMPELMTTIYGLDQNSLAVQFMKKLEAWSIARADLVLTVNIRCKRIFGSRSCRPEKIGIVMNSPDEKLFPLQSLATSRPRNVSGGEQFILMYHGSLVERNGLDLALEAVAKIRDKIPAVQLRIFGPQSPYLDRVMLAVCEKGLQEHVRYLGQKTSEEIVQEIGKCDLGIVPNQRSAFSEINTPIRIFEYIAAGRPVIAPRGAGVCDYFDDRSLLLFELGSAEDLARMIEYAYLNPAEVTSILTRGREVYREHRWSRESVRFANMVAGLLESGLTHAPSVSSFST